MSIGTEHISNYFTETEHSEFAEIRCKMCDLPFAPMERGQEEMKEHLRSHRDQITEILKSDDNFAGAQSAENLENDIKEIRSQLQALTKIVLAFYENWKASETDLIHVRRRKKAIALVEQQCGVSSASEPKIPSPAVQNPQEKVFLTTSPKLYTNERRGRPKSSPVWVFFDDFGPDEICCKASNPDGTVCGQRLTERSPVYLESHLKSKHGEMYANYLQMIGKDTNGQPAAKSARIEDNIAPEISTPPAPQPESSGTFAIKEELDLDDLSHLLPSTSAEPDTDESTHLYQGLEAIQRLEHIPDKDEVKKSLMDGDSSYKIHFITANKKSAVWQSFGHVYKEQLQLPYIACIHCNSVYHYMSANGTSSLSRHIKSCSGY